MRGMIVGHMSGLSALLTLALGYIVCLLAKKEKGLLKTAGYAIGIAIIVISSVVVLGKGLWAAKKCVNMCPMKQSSMPMMPVSAEVLKK